MEPHAIILPLAFLFLLLSLLPGIMYKAFFSCTVSLSASQARFLVAVPFVTCGFKPSPTEQRTNLGVQLLR